MLIKKEPILHARWIIDWMAVIRSLKPKKTYTKFKESLLRLISPEQKLISLSIELVNDIYREDSIKEGTRLKRGKTSPRTHVYTLEQNMLQGKDWAEFFFNNSNKTGLLRLVFQYCKNQSENLTVPIIVNDVDETWHISTTAMEIIFLCNHEELLLHASLQDTNVIVVSKDTDVLILMRTF